MDEGLEPERFAAAADADLPAVITLHDYFLFCPTGLYFDHAELRPCTRRPLGPRCLLAACDARSRAYKGVRLIRQVGSNAARARIPAPLNLIHISRPALAVARTHLPADSRHFVVPNPVPLAPQPAVAVDRNRTFVFLGRYAVDKGPVVLARAAALAGVPVAFLGAGPEEARVRALTPGAEIAAWGDDRAVARLLARARALVFPSLWQETSGLVVFEALAHGVPVICSAGTGAADWIEDGVDGFLVPAGDAVALAATLPGVSPTTTS